VYIGEGCVLGCPKEARIRSQRKKKSFAGQDMELVEIADDCVVSHNVCIYEGTKISTGTFIDDGVRIGYDCRIGRNVRIMYRAFICDRVTIGDNARVAGFVCDGAYIGQNSTVMGHLVHEYTKPHLGWWDVDESPPIVENDVVVGYRALIVGNVRIGPYVYIAAGAIVTKDVPPWHIVIGTNRHIPFSDWKGKRLKELVSFWTSLADRQISAEP